MTLLTWFGILLCLSQSAMFSGMNLGLFLLSKLNFLELDDVPLGEEGEVIDPDSVLQLEFDGKRPLFPRIEPTADDDFLRAVNRSGKSWVVIIDSEGEPRLMLNADEFIREAVFAPDRFNPYRHCHRPIIAQESTRKLGEMIPRFRVRPGKVGEDIVDDDVILLWGEQPRVVTGTDILGRLLRGIARRSTAASAQAKTLKAPGEA